MNFFRRRKILRSANYLDLTPVRRLDHEIRDDGNVSLLMPRFRKRIASTLLQPPGKAKFITIRLDRFGSQTWLLIDGVSNVGMISDRLKDQMGDELQPAGETDERVAKFFALLYQQRYITFAEIMD